MAATTADPGHGEEAGGAAVGRGGVVVVTAATGTEPARCAARRRTAASRARSATSGGRLQARAPVGWCWHKQGGSGGGDAAVVVLVGTNTPAARSRAGPFAHTNSINTFRYLPVKRASSGTSWLSCVAYKTSDHSG